MENENIKIKIAILDALADDFEGVSQIESYLLYLGLNVPRNDLTYMLKSLVDEGLICVNDEIRDDQSLWYGMTEKGREVWENSEIDFQEDENTVVQRNTTEIENQPERNSVMTMTSKKVRQFFLLFAALVFLCYILAAFSEKTNSVHYIFTFIPNWFYIYLPLAIAIFGIVVGMLSVFFEGKIKKVTFVMSIVSLCSAGAFFFMMMYSAGSAMSQEENIQKKTIAEEKFQAVNFVNEPELVPDTELPGYGSDCYAIGGLFAFYSNQSYVCPEDDWFHLDIDAYEFENVPKIFRQRIQRRIADFCFAEITDSGEINGKQYTCYTYEKENFKSGGRVQKEAYCVVLVQDERNISLLILDALYAEKYNIDISQITETLCNAESYESAET